jgi:DNA-binding NarL/FixJ family response regulator
MSVSLPSDSRPSTALRLLLIDEDPLFRLGMSVWLDQLPDIALVAEAGDGETALQILDRQVDSGERAAARLSTDPPINLVVLNVGLGRLNLNQLQGLNLCRMLKSRYPALPVLCLSDLSEPVILAAARRDAGRCAPDQPYEPNQNVRQRPEFCWTVAVR